MSRLAEILPAEHILLDVAVSSKKRAFEEIGFLFENQLGLKRLMVSDSLFARERLGSTGLGRGVAIPHGRVKGIKQAQAALLRLESPIGFDAPDGQPVQLIISLLMPEENTQQHLEILANIAQVLGDAGQREAILQASDAASLLAILQA